MTALSMSVTCIRLSHVEHIYRTYTLNPTMTHVRTQKAIMTPITWGLKSSAPMMAIGPMYCSGKECRVSLSDQKIEIQVL